MMKNIRLALAAALLCVASAAYAFVQNFNITVSIAPALNTVFNCSGFAATGACGVALIGQGGQAFGANGSPNGTPPLLCQIGTLDCTSNTQLNLVPGNGNHQALNVGYQTKVNVAQFSTTIVFVANGQNLSFILNNNTNSGFPPNLFSAGASCEGAFWQSFNVPAVMDNVFALMLDQYNSDVAGGSTFNYSSVQYYDTGHTPPNPPNAPGQDPCNPSPGLSNIPGFTYVPVNKVQTTGVPLNNPVNAQGGSGWSGDTYSATIDYDSSTLKLSICLFDVTKANGSCTSGTTGTGTFFTTTWTGVNIPAIVNANANGNTAWVGLGGSTGSAGVGLTSHSLLINSWTLATN